MVEGIDHIKAGREFVFVLSRTSRHFLLNKAPRFRKAYGHVGVARAAPVISVDGRCASRWLEIETSELLGVFQRGSRTRVERQIQQRRPLDGKAIARRVR